MKYLDRNDFREIFIVLLVLIAALLIVTQLTLFAIAVGHSAPQGCIPHVTI